MRWRGRGLALASACLALTVATPLAIAPSVQIRVADLDRDGRPERVVLAPTRDPALSVWHGERRLWQGVRRRWQPWKLAIADVDGDGRREIVVGVHKSTRYFPEPHNCLFIYRSAGSTVQPLWLGSSLSRPFTDFTFARLGKERAEALVALESMRGGKQCVTIYAWNGFGFTAERRLGAWSHARLVPGHRGPVVVEGDGRRIVIARRGP
jgi:hypothetical protein